MASPFPGMDPFLELAEWEDFHTTFNTIVRELLSPQLGAGYYLRVERRVYVDHLDAEDADWIRPDVVATDKAVPRNVSRQALSASLSSPIECAVPLPVERQEVFLVLREQPSANIVTVIETLSPSNKRPGSDGRQEYLRKRQSVLESDAHLVEIDLLRGGLRMPISGRPACDYYAMVSRSYRRPKVDVYAWNLRDALPTIDIPVKREDDDLKLPLQEALRIAFERAGYERVLPYSAALRPPPRPDDEPWVKQRLAAR